MQNSMLSASRRLVSHKIIAPRTATSSFRSSGARRWESQSVYDRSAQPTVAPPRLNIYRDLWPAILGCLGVGYVVFYGLELWRTKLDYKWQAHDQKIEIEKLKAKVETLQAENATSRSIASPSPNAPPGERRKWFGLF